jgi:hypothetical protein
MSETRVRFQDRVLVDNMVENAVDRYQLKARRRNAIVLLVVLVVAVAIVIWKFGK